MEATLTVEALDVARSVRRSSVLHRDHEGQLLGPHQPAFSVGRAEERGPLRHRHLTGFRIAPPEDAFGRVVIEDEPSVGIDDERGQREIARELARENDLDLFLSHLSQR